jgi:hypothetical protein
VYDSVRLRGSIGRYPRQPLPLCRHSRTARIVSEAWLGAKHAPVLTVALGWLRAIRARHQERPVVNAEVGNAIERHDGCL